ncbi:MAG: hypothetical protein QOE56_2095 [Solirubrobacterales bacterium]|nr:hypothetical protein [Solirubrobacterales bacterium]
MPTVPPAAEAEKDEAPKQRGGGKTKGGFKLEEIGVAGSVLAAVGGGLGVLGLVAFFGAAILWVRMDQIGVPANEAIAIVPKSVLVTTGASFLVPAVLLAIVLLGLLYLVDLLITGFTDFLFLHEEKKDLGAAEKEAKRRQASIDLAIEKTEQAAERSRQLKATARASVAAGADPDAVRQGSMEASEAVTEAHLAARGTQPAAKKADDKVAEAKEEVELVRDRRELPIELIRNVLRFILVFLVLSAAAVPGVVLSSVGLPNDQIVLVVAAVLFLSTICLFILAKTNFAWFALAIVVAVGLLNGFITYYRTKNDPKVEPVALLRSHGAPVFGFYVAQTSDRVYLSTNPVGGSTRLDSVPREEVLALVVGSLQRPTVAEEHAIAFARRLCLRAQERETTGKLVGNGGGGEAGEEVASGCTEDDLRHLADRAGS